MTFGGGEFADLAVALKEELESMTDSTERKLNPLKFHDAFIVCLHDHLPEEFFCMCVFYPVQLDFLFFLLLFFQLTNFSMLYDSLLGVGFFFFMFFVMVFFTLLTPS